MTNIVQIRRTPAHEFEVARRRMLQAWVELSRTATPDELAAYEQDTVEAMRQIADLVR